jgi:integrase
MPTTTLATPDPDDRPETKHRARKPKPKLRDGIMKRGSTWSYVIRVTDPETGLSKPRWVGGFPTEEDAKAARDEARVKARHGQYIDRNAITVGEYLDEWIDGHSMMLNRATIARYIKPNIGGLRLQAVQPAQISRLYRQLLTSGGRNGSPLSARTVGYVHTVLRKAFEDAVNVEQLITSNPVARAKRPRAVLVEPGKVWTPEQLRAFLRSAENHRLFAFFRLAAYSGARRGELLNLRWPNVDFDASEIHITGSANFVNGQRIEGTTKSGRSRVVSLDAETMKILKAHRERQEADRAKAGAGWKGGQYVFMTGWGEPVHPDTVSSLMAKLIKDHNKANEKAPLPYARLHDLRHIHATLLLIAGVPVHLVAARLGHSDPAITLRVYAHVINARLSEAADAFAKLIEPEE